MTLEIDKFFRCPNCQSFSLSKSDPNFREKAIALFIPAFVYECSNCSYRYIDNDAIAIKSRFKKTVFFIVLPLLIVSFLYLLNLTSDDSEKIEVKPIIKKDEKKTKPELIENKVEEDKKNLVKDPKNNVDKTESKNIKNDEKTEEISEVIAEDDKPEISKELNKKPKINYIVCGNSKMYGVNWKETKDGIQIMRITPGGVFFNGGIKKGDVLTEANGKKIINGTELNQERDKLYSRKIDFIDLKVKRDETILEFRLVKVNDYKVFDRSVLKVRSSHPLNKERQFRWKYITKSVKVFRNEDQKVFISGDFSGMENWAVDDTIIINDKNFPGIKGGIGVKSKTIDDDRKLAPLDITDIVPAGKNFTLKIELANHGKLFGNTDIFVIVKYN